MNNEIIIVSNSRRSAQPLRRLLSPWASPRTNCGSRSEVRLVRERESENGERT
jgi:hypothetical protein